MCETCTVRYELFVPVAVVAICSMLFILCSPDKSVRCCVDTHLIIGYTCKFDMYMCVE
jgi:hypothetical protein